MSEPEPSTQKLLRRAVAESAVQNADLDGWARQHVHKTLFEMVEAGGQHPKMLTEELVLAAPGWWRTHWVTIVVGVVGVAATVAVAIWWG